MSLIISGVGCSLLASVIYDICKIFLGKFLCEQYKLSVDKISELLKENIDDKFEILYTSGEFNSFLKTPVFEDTIENYIIYKITGNCKGNIINLKKTTDVIVEKDIITFLSEYLLKEYYKETLSIPSKTLVRQFFEKFFQLSTDYIVSYLKKDDKADVYLINRRIDIAQQSILLRIDETIEIINKTMRCEYIPPESKYEEYVNEYHKILQTNNSRAHVYLLDTFDFSEFYVPPFLREISPKQEKHEYLEWMRRDSMYIRNNFIIDQENFFDNWKHIFDYNHIVYVTGGAGYGKSLFLKKIINDFCNMNMLNCSEYLVIYGDLKSFFVEGDEPISIVKFLQKSMLKETLMDESKISIEMIEYYIKMGRCLILFDALDEVEKAKRENLHKKIIAYFKNQNPNNRICITSRNRGFIPETDVEAFDILPLNRTQIETYVDNIIKLGRFDYSDKEMFLEQSSILVDKGFLNSFLVLSLLINIYKAERELPENKMELYQKCFDYIAYRREKEKTKEKFDWDLISCMMKDNTFIELAKMCFPNNSDIGKSDIVDMLCKTYGGKYTSESEAERAAEHFLAFCSDRTELFVPAAGEDRFKFFHRSFFEYFYSQYIFLRIREVEDVYNSLTQFDVDSEVFELTFAMMKQKDEFRYQELVEYIFDQINTETKIRKRTFTAFNILTLGMQVIDDNIYICRYVDYLVDNRDRITRYINRIQNQQIIYNIIVSNDKLIDKIIDAYEDNSKFRIIQNFLDMFSKIASTINSKDYEKLPEDEQNKYIIRRFYYRYADSSFYLRIYYEYMDYTHLLVNFSESDLEKLFSMFNVTKQSIEKYKKLLLNYQALDKEKREVIQSILLNKSNKYEMSDLIKN